MKSRVWFTIIIIIVLGVLAYLAYSYRTVLIPSGTESVINKLETQSASDEVTSIESDLQVTELQSLDSELESIDKEFQNIGL